MRDLRAGDSGQFVTYAQLRLMARGYAPVSLSGQMDDATMALIRALQEDWGLPVTGEVDGDTWSALISTEPPPAKGPVFFGEEEDEYDDDAPEFDALRAGYDGELLLSVQLRLRAAGFEVPTLEPALGPQTAAAICAFQAELGVEASGELSYEGWLTLQGRTAGVDLLTLLTEAEAADQAGPVFFGGDYRDVDGAGGYRYRQYEDGSIEIRVDPQRRIQGRVFSSGAAWQAITKEIGPYPEPPARGERDLVKRGSRGDDAKAAQRRLNELGFGPLSVDGIFGRGSEDALKRFQAAAGLDDDGECGAGTWAKLDDPWPTVSPGAKGPVVTQLQQRLVALGQGIQADGDYGDKTTAAVRAFQAEQKLPVTGVIDPITRGHLLGTRTATVPVDLIEAEKARLRGILEVQLASLPATQQAKVRPVLEQAIRSVGIRESWGPNQGPEVNVITEGFSDPKAPWCALAVSYWVKTGTGAQSWRDVPWGFQNASSMYFGQWGEKQHRVLSNSGPAPVGAIMVMERAGSGSDAAGGGGGAASRFAQRPGHTALVLQDLGDQVMTIDGNVSDTCKACTRKKSGLLGFVTWW